MKKKILLGLLAIFLAIQLFQPAKNNSDDQQYHISKKYEVPAEVATILKNACDDCHSNKTEYPWYAHVQPAAWWLANHVNDGKKHLNVSKFTNLKIAVQNHKFEEIVEMVEEKEMPLKSYTWMGLHSDANLTDAQRQTLTSWAKAQMDTLKAQYPADSLILKRPSAPPPVGK
jgi:Haem-binding domain